MTCWGSVRLDKDILDAAPDLKLVTHAAGSVKPVVTEEFIRRGIVITTAAPALAIGVAEFNLAAMIMMGKRLPEQLRAVAGGGWHAPNSDAGLDFFDPTIGIVGAGYVGRHLIKLLRNFDVAAIWIYDPCLSATETRALGVARKSLAEIFSGCDFINLCAPLTPGTKGMVDRRLIKMIKDDAVFINSARSGLVDEECLIQELQTGRFCAAIDVTHPEPPPANHPLRNLPNVLFTPQIAGAISRNFIRNGESVCREISNFVGGKPPIHPVDLTKLHLIA